jgi:signal transduction histidine kinase
MTSLPAADVAGDRTRIVMSRSTFAIIYFFYGLAFFSMGFIVLLERGRGSDKRLRHSLRPLAAFGLIHGAHEWLELFQIMGMLPGYGQIDFGWEAVRLILLAFSFLSLTAFGASLLSPNERIRRISLLLPLIQAGIWVFGLLIMRGHYTIESGLLDLIDVWSRYVLGIPAALVACAGLIAQQRAFRQVGMVQFGRDSLWAAVAFAWYGLAGQIFTRASPLPPSATINQALFLELFGFPVQLMRAVAAGVAALFVIRFLRSFEVETQRQISELQAARLEDAERREALRGELLRRVVAAQEAERQRIARELHDETGQALTATGLGLRGVATLLQRDAARAANNLRELEKLVAHSLDELQHLIADLRPSHLDDLGLPATLRWWVGELEKRGAMSVKVEVVGDERELAHTVRLALFRVTQEAVTNIIKHAGATIAMIMLCYESDAVVLRVQDNGCGFDVSMQATSRERPSWGLLGMKERATLLGGQFSITSRPGTGTSVTVAIPYELEETDQRSEVLNDNTSASG